MIWMQWTFVAVNKMNIGLMKMMLALEDAAVKMTILIIPAIISLPREPLLTQLDQELS